MRLRKIAIIVLVMVFGWCCGRATAPEPPREETITVIGIDGEAIHTREFGEYRCPENHVRVHLLRGRRYRVIVHRDVITEVVGWYNPTTEMTGEVDHE